VMLFVIKVQSLYSRNYCGPSSLDLPSGIKIVNSHQDVMHVRQICINQKELPFRALENLKIESLKKEAFLLIAGEPLTHTCSLKSTST